MTRHSCDVRKLAGCAAGVSMRLPMLLFCFELMMEATCLMPVAALAQGAPSSGAAAPRAPALGAPGKPLDTGLGSAPNAAAAAAGQTPGPAQGSPDPVVGSVEGHLIYLSDLGEASKTLPENLRGLPFDTLYPVLLDRMIDHEALVIMSRRKGLEQTKQVQHEIQTATERILEGAYLAQV